MIRNAVIHLNNEQPLLCDLYALPGPTDVSLVCTNIRTPDGHKPVFIDHTKSTFVFPYLNIRFLEIPPGAVTEEDVQPIEMPDGAMVPARWVPPSDDDGNGADDELDEDFLQRIRDI